MLCKWRNDNAHTKCGVNKPSSSWSSLPPLWHWFSRFYSLGIGLAFASNNQAIDMWQPTYRTTYQSPTHSPTHLSIYKHTHPSIYHMCTCPIPNINKGWCGGHGAQYKLVKKKYTLTYKSCQLVFWFVFCGGCPP